jgi:hypothetical protein
MNRPRLINGLQIAWTARRGIVCVLLAVLWIRSYWVDDVVWVPFTGYLQLNSNCGDVRIIANAENRRPLWQFDFSTPRAYNRHWFFKFEAHPRFVWWLDITIPHWCLTILVAIGATAPWIHCSRRFSLRTLLIATTQTAIMLGLVVWSIR